MSLSVAVIVPVFNRVTMIVQALDSIARQSRRPQRVMVVDDGSTDGSGDAVARWIEAGSGGLDVRLIRQANKGVSHARNRAAAEAGECELFAFLDSDDLWPPDYLSRMVAALEADGDAVAVSCDQSVIDGVNGQVTLIDQSMFDGPITPLLVVPRMPPLPSATVIRARLFHGLGGFDPAYIISQDRHLFMRLSLLGPWRYVPAIAITYRRNQMMQHAGAPQLTERFWSCDERETWWSMVQRFLMEQGGQGAVDMAAWRLLAAGEWMKMGRRREARRQYASAVACFDRAAALDGSAAEAGVAAARAGRRWRRKEQEEQRRKSVITAPLPSPPRIAVIVPVYCRAQVVEEALDSIARQTLPPAKVVIVDDGSCDDTADRVAAWIIRHRGRLDATLVRQANAGVGAARVAGVNEAGGCDLLAFLDSDDLWPADFLQRAAAAFAATPGAVAAQADVRSVDVVCGAAKYSDQSLHSGWIAPLLFDLLLCQTSGDDRFEFHPPPVPPSTVIHAQAYRRAGGFDPAHRVRGDVDLDMRLALLGPFTHIPGEPVTQRRGLDQTRGGAMQLTHLLGSIEQRLAAWRLLAQFLERHGRSAGLSRRARLQLFRVIRSAGLHEHRRGERETARQCFEIAVRVAPLTRWWSRLKLRRLLARLPAPAGQVLSLSNSAPPVSAPPVRELPGV